jgi:Putative beta-lactamase-inhibitor-like, PepSY-like
MKKSSILLVAVLLSSLTFAQKIQDKDVPVLVVSAFKSKFPLAIKPTWELEKTNEYEVGFKLNNEETSANFDNTGKWLETEVEIKVAALPTAVQTVLRKDFAGFKIDEASKIESMTNGKCFEAEVKKGAETFDLLFTSDGKLISKTKLGKGEKD